MWHKNLTKMFLKARKDPFIVALIILIAIGVVLRFVNFEGHVTFLGDQGRDSIVLRRIVTFEDFPGIGASSSVGNLFLGPFYYYFAAPWLLLANFNPVGPAFGVALFSLLMIPAMYFVGKDLFNKKVGLLAALLTTLSYSMVWLSRFSWNPNLLPLASLIAVYFFIKGIRTWQFRNFFISGLAISAATQMHYASLALGLPIFLIIGWRIYRHPSREDLVRTGRGVGSMLLGILLLHIPMVVFELKNNFLNTRGFFELFTDSRSSGLPFLQEVIYTFNEFNLHALQFRTVDIVSVVLLIAILLGLVLYRSKEERNIRLLSFFFVTMLMLTAVFTENKNRHYFGALYPVYYLMIAYVLARYLWNKKTVVILVAVLGVFVYWQRPVLNYFTSPGAHLISRAENISKGIYDNIEGETLQVTSLPDHYGDYMYRYYLEVWGKRPVERASLIKADELYVVCQDPCSPIGDPQWDIAYFEPTEIVGQWNVEDVTIYKLIRN